LIRIPIRSREIRRFAGRSALDFREVETPEWLEQRLHRIAKTNGVRGRLQSRTQDLARLLLNESTMCGGHSLATRVQPGLDIADNQSCHGEPRYFDASMLAQRWVGCKLRDRSR
jgi:hypothetical protein